MGSKEFRLPFGFWLRPEMTAFALNLAEIAKFCIQTSGSSANVVEIDPGAGDY